VWTIEAAYVDPRWLNGQDPHYDYAFLVVAAQQQGGRPVRLNQVVTGNSLGLAPDPGSRVQVIAYANGMNGKPITCTVPTNVVAGYPFEIAQHEDLAVLRI